MTLLMINTHRHCPNNTVDLSSASLEVLRLVGSTSASLRMPMERQSSSIMWCLHAMRRLFSRRLTNPLGECGRASTWKFKSGIFCISSSGECTNTIPGRGGGCHILAIDTVVTHPYGSQARQHKSYETYSVGLLSTPQARASFAGQRPVL